MDDAQLVLAVRAGDSAALAAIYDRYADRIHDFAGSTVRNRADATAVTHETFLVAFEHLDQLRQPERLRPWLYAIAHHSALNRIAGRPRSSRPNEMGEELTLPAATDERMSRAELSEFVWMAAAQLSDRDRAFLDLHLRQGLEGRDLADTAGVSSASLPVALNRLRAGSERSLGALLVARTGRRSCPQLSQILERSPGPLTSDLWDRVTSHVDDCEICNSRRRIALSPLELLAAVPPVPAPASLRRVALGQAGAALAGAAPAGVGAGWLFTRGGFPYLGGDAQPELPTGPLPIDPGATIAIPANPAFGSDPTRASVFQPRRPTIAPTTVNPMATSYAEPATATYRPPPPPPPRQPEQPGEPYRNLQGILIGALAGLIILIGGITAFVATKNRGSSRPVAVTPSTGVPATTIPATTSAIPATTSTTTSVSTTVVAGPGRLVVGAAGIDFGVTGASQSLVVGNNGGSSITFTATPSSPLVTVTPATNNVDIGMSETLSVTLDRSSAPVGKFSGTIVIASEGGSATVAVAAVIDPGPAITGETPPTAVVIYKAPCLVGPNTATITASVNGPVALKTVVLHWQLLGGGAASSATMTGIGSSYSGMLGPFASPGPAEWWITAADTAGIMTTTSHHQFMVKPCI